MKAAAEMFSLKGFDRVTTREIANYVGINSASIYYHFSSKEDILKSLYKFYTEVRYKEQPDINELLRLAETRPPHEVLMNSEFHYDDEIRDTLDQILATAARELCSDLDSEIFIRENVFNNVENILKPLLSRLAELGKIKPFDIDTFIKVVSFYCYSAAALNNSPFRQSVADYQAGMALLFSIIDYSE